MSKHLLDVISSGFYFTEAHDACKIILNHRKVHLCWGSPAALWHFAPAKPQILKVLVTAMFTSKHGEDEATVFRPLHLFTGVSPPTTWLQALEQLKPYFTGANTYIIYRIDIPDIPAGVGRLWDAMRSVGCRRSDATANCPPPKAQPPPPFLGPSSSWPGKCENMITNVMRTETDPRDPVVPS